MVQTIWETKECALFKKSQFKVGCPKYAERIIVMLNISLNRVY